MASVRTPAGLDIEYETYGVPGDPAILLVMGLSMQLIAWPREFCQRLADAGRFVICYDNRDCGLSTKCHEQPVDLGQIIAKLSAGDFASASQLAPYSIADMAGDGIALLDGLGLAQAHVVGSSMGGVIAQTMAIQHPDRVLTLTSMMSATGEPEYGQSTPEAMSALMTPAPSDRAGYINAATRTRIWSSKKYFDERAAMQLAAESYDRSHYPAGASRQIAALITCPSRADRLRTLSVPTLVIHGLDDTLVAPSGGERTADLVPDARLLLIEDMGHDRPVQLWPQICGAIIEHTADGR